MPLRAEYCYALDGSTPALVYYTCFTLSVFALGLINCCMGLKANELMLNFFRTLI